MGEARVDVVYQCFVCGEAYSKVQSLRAHLKKHKGHNFVRTTIWADRDKWAEFEKLCKDHKTTTCHLLLALIDAALKGEKMGAISIPTVNPLIINVQHHFYGRPRSVYKVEVPAPEALLVSGGPEPSRFAEPVAPPGPPYPVWRRRRQVVLGRDPDWLKRQLEI